ncbi:cytochrome P450 [Streptomyces sp. NBC_00873]|uniref:cytochrome P450 n=1 Tax=unclassified Streptomyces TaxID=2593676 RepID=UPI00386EA20F|nr:cytochrome P450 [Streptomyces sp. NBC_00873]WTA41972.1 cytochrome P450 [Streptomyces sp. NBC_00842]
MRVAAEDVDLHGTRIRTGDAVQFILVSANRDPRRHPVPGCLGITRGADEQSEGHIGFGHGIHYCLGASLARLQCEVALGALLARYPDLPLAVPAARMARRVIAGTAPRLTELPLAV